MTLRGFKFGGRSAALALALALAAAPGVAEARAGGGFSLGSRGMRTWSAPPVTNTAPRPAAPMERSATPQMQPGSGFNSPLRPNGGFFGGGFGRGLLGGFIGAGLFGLLFGHGFFGGIGGLMSMFGFLIQIALLWFLARFAWNWLNNRQQPAFVGASRRSDMGMGGPQPGPRAFQSGWGGARPVPLKVDAADFNAFERQLNLVQTAYGAEDRAALARLASPEMVAYFDEQFADNARKGVVNRVSGVRLLSGDLSEAWREGAQDYATVAMRFAVIDTIVDRASGRIVSGDPANPVETTEVWTFARPAGASVDSWRLSAIQQT